MNVKRCKHIRLDTRL